MPKVSRLKVKKIRAAWWIVDGEETYGPYDRMEALEDRDGLEEFYRHEHDPEFGTVCPIPPEKTWAQPEAPLSTGPTILGEEL